MGFSIRWWCLIPETRFMSLIHHRLPRCCLQEGRVRVTLLARSTEYRRIINQAEVGLLLWLFLSSFVPHPSFSSALACFSSLFVRPGSIFHFSLLIHNLWALLHTSVHLLGVAVWKPCFTVNSLWFMLIYVHNHHQLTPLLCLKLVNALKTVALLEVNVVDYRYKWVWRGWLYAMDSYQQYQNNGQMDSTPPVSTCPIHLLKIKQWTIFGQRE